MFGPLSTAHVSRRELAHIHVQTLRCIVCRSFACRYACTWRGCIECAHSELGSELTKLRWFDIFSQRIKANLHRRHCCDIFGILLWPRKVKALWLICNDCYSTNFRLQKIFADTLLRAEQVVFVRIRHRYRRLFGIAGNHSDLPNAIGYLDSFAVALAHFMHT